MSSNTLKGKAYIFGDNISTDLICPGRYYHLRSDIEKLAEHVLEDARPEFASEMEAGNTFVIAGKDMGLGSSREHAPLIIKVSGCNAVLCKSVARIFYRNCINVGLPIITCDTSKIKEGDQLEVDLSHGIVKNITQDFEINFDPFPSIMTDILEAGGLVEYIKKYGDFKL
ncbi:MAG: 3-isopropylmalate dehydratase [Candidatus Lokiarchaeota archaeon]|nr:3-isopropylmalate dehydratase [Candidatus Lokiarchaeota archaeon]